MGIRGLIKASAYYNNIEARKDWERIAALYPDIAAQFTPPENAGWRTIDKAIAKVRAAVAEQATQRTPDSPPD